MSRQEGELVPERRLSELFPKIPFAGVADDWLAEQANVSVSEQIRGRGVRGVKIEELLSGGGVERGEDGYLIVGLNDWNNLEENIQTLGHELAHTFGFDLSATPPRETFPGGSLTDELFDQLELFCDEFSRRWLAMNFSRQEEIKRIIEQGLPAQPE